MRNITLKYLNCLLNVFGSNYFLHNNKLKEKNVYKIELDVRKGGWYLLNKLSGFRYFVSKLHF